MMRLWLIVLGVLVLAPTAALAKPTSYGIAIGYNLSPEGTALPTLHYADDDAVRFFRHFRRLTDDAALLAILDDDTFKRYPELRTAIRAPTTASAWQASTKRCANENGSFARISS